MDFFRTGLTWTVRMECYGFNNYKHTNAFVFSDDALLKCYFSDKFNTHYFFCDFCLHSSFT